MACDQDWLSECSFCGDKFCGLAKTGCKSVCSCDRLADHLHALRELSEKGWFTRLWQAVNA